MEKEIDKEEIKSNENTLTKSFEENLKKEILNYSNETNTDIFIYSGPIGYTETGNPQEQPKLLPELFINTIIGKNNKKDNCLLFLTTYGGNPDFAYKIAAVLKNAYKTYSVVICGYCKSAGTLICLGAKKLFFSDKGEIGPLDIQTKKQNNFLKVNQV